jgi:hypothetical protein
MELDEKKTEHPLIYKGKKTKNNGKWMQTDVQCGGTISHNNSIKKILGS